MSTEPPQRAVTGADVAKLAGVSTAVVSYVVNGGPRPVAPDTAERVRRAIRLLGYAPNVSARALRTGHPEIIGLALPDSTNPYFAELAHAIQEEAARHDQVVVTANHHDDAERQLRLVDNLLRRGIDRLLVASPDAAAEALVAERAGRGRRAGGSRLVLIDCGRAVAGAITVGADHESGSVAGVRHLVDVHGHDRVALLSGEDPASGTTHRETGWRRALTESGAHAGLLLRGRFSREAGYALGRQLLAGPDRPRAVFVTSDLQTFGLLHAVREAGLRVPEDLAVVTFDDTVGARYTWPPLTAVRQPVAAMATAAVAAALGPDDMRPERHTLPMSLVIRRSCGCPPDPDAS